MKFIIDNWMLIALALTSGGMLLWPTFAGGAQGGITPDAAVQLINREKAIVIDVREPGEFASGHIKGARNLPVASFEQRLPEVAKNKALPLVLVCATSMRANRCAAIAKRLGHENAQVIAGGMKAWGEANLPSQKGA